MMEISSSILVRGSITLYGIAISLQRTTPEDTTIEDSTNLLCSQNTATLTASCKKTSPDFFATSSNPQRYETTDHSNDPPSQNIGWENRDNLVSSKTSRSTETTTTTNRQSYRRPEVIGSTEKTWTTTNRLSHGSEPLTSTKQKLRTTTNGPSSGPKALTSTEEKRMITTTALSDMPEASTFTDEKTRTTTHRQSNGSGTSRSSEEKTTSKTDRPEVLMSTEENPMNLTSPPSNGPETIAAVRELMEQRGLVPLAVLGIVLNALSLWVWGAENAYNATTFLFKYLAVCDSLSLITFILFVSRIHDLLGKVALPISNVSQRVSVHTTLLVSVTRWLAVSRPLHVRSLLAKARVRLACVALLTWSVLIEGLYFYSAYGRLDRQTSWTMYYLQRVLGLALPLVLMVIFNVLLIVKSCRPREDVGLSSQQNMLEARYRLTVAAACISMCSLIAYPIGIITEIVTNVQCYQGNVYVCDRFFVFCIKYITFALQLINLGINFVFYVAFAGRFRHLLAARMRPFCCCFFRDGTSGMEPPGTSAGVLTNTSSSGKL